MVGRAASFIRRRVSGTLELPYKEARRQLLDTFEAYYLEAHLERADGNVSRMARITGMNRTYLNEVLKKRGLR